MLATQPKKLCKIISYIKDDTSILFETENGKIKIDIISENVVRICYTKKEDFKKEKSLSVVAKPNCIYSLNESEDFLEINTKKIKVKISKADFRISYYDKNNSLIYNDPIGGGKYLQQYEVYMPVYNGEQNFKRIMTPDGEKTIINNTQTEYQKDAFHSKLEFNFSDDEAIFGLGQQEDGIFNLRGKCVYLYQQNMKNPIPFIVSTKGYGIFVDCNSQMIFHDDQYGSYIFGECVEQMDYYFISGSSFDEIIGGYRFLTGAAPMLPLWSLGYIQSRERYETQKETIEIATEFRKRKIPLDLIVMDWRSWEGEQWGQKSFDKSRFQNPKEMIDALHQMDIYYMISIWPAMRVGGENEIELKKSGGFFPNSDTYNAFDEKARDLYWKQANDGYFKYGVDAWWTDCSEPFCPDWVGEIQLPPALKYQKVIEAYKQIGNDEYANAYPLLHAKGIYENQRECSEQKRVVNLTRAVYSGQQRYSTIIWSGDIYASWENMKKQIAAGLNACVSGMPYWTLDIGAFYTKRGDRWFWNGDYDDGNKDEEYRELYTRWIQFGAFLPMFRSHGTDTEREPWFFGDEGEIYYDTIVKYIYLRYSLIPYIYSLNAKVTFENYTILRMLAFDFLGDKDAIKIDDQFMLGNALMVCPITEKDCKQKKVYLPKNKRWYDFFSNNCFDGGRTITVPTTINDIPVFVPSGSIIPLYPKKVQSTNEMIFDNLKINVYSGDNAEFSLYLDEGNNYNYEKGDFASIKFFWEQDANTLNISEIKGDFKGINKNISLLINLITPETQIQKTIAYNGESQQIIF